MPETPNGDPHVCARCGRCCVLATPGDAERAFPILPADAERMDAAARAALKRLGKQGDWLAEEPTTEAFRQAMSELMALAGADMDVLFPPEGTHRRLATGRDGSCRLLGPEGCSLERENRPLHCRLFPFWVRGGAIMVSQSDCLALEEAARIEDVYASMGIRPAHVRDMHRRLLKRWGR